MSTILEFRRYPFHSTSARHPFRSYIPLHAVGYALVLALILASLVFSPSTMLAGQAEVGCVPAPDYAD